MGPLTDIQLADLLGGGDEESMRRKAAQLSAALRQEQAAAQAQQFHGGLAGYFNTPGATAFGKSLQDQGASQYEQAGKQLEQIPRVTESRLKLALEKQQQGQQAKYQDAQVAHLGATEEMQRKELALKGRQRFSTVAPGGTTYNVETGEIGSTSPVAKPVSTAGSNQAFKNSSDTRKEYSGLPEVKSFGEVQTSFDKLKGALASGSPAGDLAGITAFMKLLDPGSTVKDAEFANAEKAVGMIDRMQNHLSRVASGEKLTPEQRADFLRNAQGFTAEHKKARDAKRKFYRDLAERNGLRADDVTGPLEAAAAASGESLAEMKAKLKQLEAGGGAPK